MSKIVDLENAKLYKVTTTTKRRDGSVISNVEIYVYALSIPDAMKWTNISFDDECCEIKIEEVDGFIDSKFFVKEKAL